MSGKSTKKAPTTETVLPEYDFRGGVRGRYAASYRDGTNVAVLDPDIAEIFPDSDSVNTALRPIADLIRRRTKAKV